MQEWIDAQNDPAKIRVFVNTFLGEPYVEKGDALTEGSINPHDVLKVQGVEGVHYYLLKEVQSVYRLQGVDINDKHIATSTMPPYSVYLGELKESNELKIVVSNTVANAYNNSDYFTVQDIRDVGIYHEKMKEYEAQASPGGLIGPVVIKKIV